MKREEYQNKHETVYFGSGCFWCTEAVFQQLEGVVSVVPGYSGGTTKNPSYHEVCMEKTGHAEVVKIVFQPLVIHFNELLDVFFKTHDPTTRNRQGNDTGTRYRSVILYTSDQQRQKAEEYIRQLNKAGIHENPVVTELVPFEVFYEAEEKHQNFYKKHEGQPYCQYIIQPKLNKLNKFAPGKIK